MRCCLAVSVAAQTGQSERDREFIAGFADERARLWVAQVVGIRRLATADQAGLLGKRSASLGLAG